MRSVEGTTRRGEKGGCQLLYCYGRKGKERWRGRGRRGNYQLVNVMSILEMRRRSRVSHS